MKKLTDSQRSSLCHIGTIVLCAICLIVYVYLSSCVEVDDNIETSIISSDQNNECAFNSNSIMNTVWYAEEYDWELHLRADDYCYNPVIWDRSSGEMLWINNSFDDGITTEIKFVKRNDKWWQRFELHNGIIIEINIIDDNHLKLNYIDGELSVTNVIFTKSTIDDAELDF